MSISAVAQGILTVVFFAILARLLEPKMFGIIAAGQSFIMISFIISQFGFWYILIQQDSIKQDEINTAFSFSLIFAFLCAMLIFFFSGRISIFYEMPNLTPYLQFMCLTVVFQGYIGIKEAILKRNMNFKIIAWAQVGSYILSYGLVGIVLAVIGCRGWSIAIAFTLQYLLLAVFYFVFSKGSVCFKVNFQSIKHILKNGKNFTVAEIFFGLAANGEKIIIGKLLGEGALGYYSRAYQIMILPSAFFGRVIDQVLMSSISRVQTQINMLKIEFLRGVNILFSIIGPFSVLVIVLAPEIISILLGSQWDQAISLLRILTLAIIFRLGYNLSDSFAKGLGLYYQRLLTTGIFLFSTFFFTIVGTFTNGLEGACTGVVLGNLTSFFVMLWFLKNKIKFSLKEYLLALVNPLIFIINVGFCSYLYIYTEIFSLLPGFIQIPLFLSATFLLLTLQYCILPNQDLRWIFKHLYSTFRPSLATLSLQMKTLGK